MHPGYPVVVTLWRENITTHEKNDPYRSRAFLNSNRVDVHDNMTAGFVVSSQARLVPDFNGPTPGASFARNTVRGYLTPAPASSTKPGL